MLYSQNIHINYIIDMKKMSTKIEKIKRYKKNLYINMLFNINHNSLSE
jgi:hypothetical protein